ncbi:MAG: SGNH/GDSL hydrolase family protein [Cyanobium sp.]|jgi:acyl-CoA thioesterase-1
MKKRSAMTGRQKLRIMPMGDSITEGVGAPGGYRQPLYDLLTGKRYDVDFVGSKRTAGDPTRDPHHWGISGVGIAATDSLVGGRRYVSLQANEGPNGAVRKGLLSEIPRAISTQFFSRDRNSTNVLLLMVGTNDVVHQVVERKGKARPAGDVGNDGRGEQQGAIAEAAIDRLQALLKQVDASARAGALKLKVIVGTIPTFTNGWNQPRLRDPISTEMVEQVSRYNERIRAIPSRQAFTNISVSTVDQNRAIGWNLADGLHPNAQGYRAMAQAWLGGIEQVLS